MLFLSIFPSTFLSPFGYGCRTTAWVAQKLHSLSSFLIYSCRAFMVSSWEYFFRKYAFQLIVYLFGSGTRLVTYYHPTFAIAIFNWLFWYAWGRFAAFSAVFFVVFGIHPTVYIVATADSSTILEDCLCYSSLLCTNEHCRPLCRTCPGCREDG